MFLILLFSDSAPGLDGISYAVIRKLPQITSDLLLELFNRFFLGSEFPTDWRNTNVIFIPKPGGKSFRPISLTSTLCKLFERIVHKRLEHVEERGNFIPNSSLDLGRDVRPPNVLLLCQRTFLRVLRLGNTLLLLLLI